MSADLTIMLHKFYSSLTGSQVPVLRQQTGCPIVSHNVWMVARDFNRSFIVFRSSQLVKLRRKRLKSRKVVGVLRSQWYPHDAIQQARCFARNDLRAHLVGSTNLLSQFPLAIYHETKRGGNFNTLKMFFFYVFFFFFRSLQVKRFANK